MMNNPEKLEIYNRMLIDTNAVMNLTAHKTQADSWHKNIEDSLLFQPEFEKLGSARLLDIGSGAGLPGIPLAVMCPDLHVTMLDSVNKKVNFINGVITNMNLTNAAAIHARIEDFPRKEHFDAVTCKAVASLPTLIEYAVPFLKTGGCLYAFKGQNYADEVAVSAKALTALNCKIERIEKAELDPETVRFLIIIKKMGKSANIYPRKKNLPRTHPMM